MRTSRKFPRSPGAIASAHGALVPALCVLALVVAVAGVLAPRSAPAAVLAAPADMRSGGMPFERLLFGDSRDDQRLQAGAPPLIVFHVPAGSELWLTDVDATSGGLVLWRRSQNLLAQVGFVVDRAAVGLGQSSRSYATGIRFGPDEDLLIEAAGGDVEWAALRGRLTPLAQSAAGP